MTRCSRWRGAWVAVLLAAALPAPAADLLDSFQYPDAKAAGAAWRAIGASPAAQVAADGVVFRCPFDGDLDRVYWDRAVALDLSSHTSFELDLTCDNPAALRSFAVYFRSGDGWYIWSRPLRESGRQRLVMARSDFTTEGNPAGWDRIDRIRLSPWRSSPTAARLVAHRFTAQRDQLFVVSATQSAPDAAARALSARVTQRVSGWLRNVGLRHAVITEEDLVRNGGAGSRVLILPYNPQPEGALMETLRRYVAAGGRLIVCYSESAELAALMGVKLGDYLQSRDPARWTSMVFEQPEEWNLPECVYQHSWNIRTAQPIEGRGRVLARWANADGAALPEPAWLATDRGFWMTHVLMDDDRAGKERLLLGLVGRFDPSAWAQAALHAAEQAGKIDDFPTLAATVDGIRRLADGGPAQEAVEARLAQAVKAHGEMKALLARGARVETVLAADQVRTLLAEAYSQAQRPRTGELRGVWDHDGVGWFPGDWDRTCRILRDHGINTIFPNMLWAGLAHYPSKVVPGSDSLRRYGDQMKACLAAARRNGLAVHVWVVLWQVDNAPADFVARLRKQGRLQQTADGRTLNWMNPAMPANVNHELSALEELVRAYDVDGVHLDYVRYPDANACYAPATRRAYEAWLGRALLPWPASVRAGAQQANFRTWRARVITDFVRAAGRRMKAVKPDLKVSAAVWGGYPDTIASIGQDWGAWLREGDVDFVCPMDYSEDQFRFSALVQKHVQLPGARNRIYPGIGVTSAESQLRPDEVVEQIAALRRLGANGFVLFDLSQTLRLETLPILSRGATRPAPADAPPKR